MAFLKEPKWDKNISCHSLNALFFFFLNIGEKNKKNI